MPTLLLLLLLIPLASAILVALLGAKSGPAVRWTSLGSTLVSLVLAVLVTVNFAGLDRVQESQLSTPLPKAPVFHPEFSTAYDLVPLSKTAAIQFFVGIDGLNVWLVALTALLMVSSVLVSWNAVQSRVNEFYAWLLALQAAMVGVFLSFDIVLFYVFFELTLVPLFFLIGIWGGPQRQYAARKFFVYTLAGSLITLLGVLGIVFTLAQEHPTGEVTFSIPKLVQRSSEVSRSLSQAVVEQRQEVAEAGDAALKEAEQTRLEEKTEHYHYWQKVQLWVFAAMTVGFAVKVPLFPFHTWLPLAHVEAPTAGSVLLAGVLLKLGSYGFLRLCIPMVPDGSLAHVPLISSLAVIGILYGAWCAFAQDDIKKLVAYSSVSHLGYCILGLFALNEIGLTGGLMQMINHGLSTGGLFLLVGMLYEPLYHTRKMDDYGGMGAKLKLLSVFMVFICMSRN